MIHLIYIFTKLHWQREEWPFIHLKFDYLAHVIDKDVDRIAPRMAGQQGDH